MRVEIDKSSGFCFGVDKAINIAADYLKSKDKLYCLGDIVHNNKEVERLSNIGLVSITYEEFTLLKNTTVLVRAHGEPLETYRIAKENNIKIIDATCPIVSKFQEKIRKSFGEEEKDTQLVIYGKKNHPEVVGFCGQVNNKAIVVSDESDINNIDFTKPVKLFTQTTKSKEDFEHIAQLISDKMVSAQNGTKPMFTISKTLCGHVSKRKPNLEKFCNDFKVIIFVAGKKSSNGKTLFEYCKSINPNTYWVSERDEINLEWFVNVNSIGISGATSTPQWLMEEIKKYISSL